MLALLLGLHMQWISSLMTFRSVKTLKEISQAAASAALL